MVTEPEREEQVEEPEEAVAEEAFTLEKGKEQVADAVDRVKQASKEVTTRPLLDAVGNYFNRGIEALIGLAEGIEGSRKKKDEK